MTSPAIQSVLLQMQSLATQATGESAKGNHISTAIGKGGFAGELHASIERINQLQSAASAKRVAFERGDPSVALNDVMVDMQKASIAFQMGAQVRNRLVTAYKEIMNMQV